MVALSAFDDAIEEMIESVKDQPPNSQTQNDPSGIWPRYPPASISTAQQYLAARLKAAQSTEESKTKEIIDSVHQLRRAYLHGLEHVHQLTELEHAPDAILYGNFREEEPQALDTSNESKK